VYFGVIFGFFYTSSRTHTVSGVWWRHVCSPGFLEEFFSETGLPVFGVLGKLLSPRAKSRTPTHDRSRATISLRCCFASSRTVFPWLKTTVENSSLSSFSAERWVSAGSVQMSLRTPTRTLYGRPPKASPVNSSPFCSFINEVCPCVWHLLGSTRCSRMGARMVGCHVRTAAGRAVVGTEAIGFLKLAV
jgi:hypothetical protein